MTVLIIEDNVDFATLIKGSLKGASVHIVGTLAAAQQYLREFTPNLVLVDLGLPDSRGLDTLKALVTYKIPKVVITASGHLANRCAEFGAMDYLTKGGDINDLIERVNFNVTKCLPRPRQRFAPDTFEQIKAYLLVDKIGSKLTEMV